jgi:sugar phosphate isomerase/epimerase
MTAMPITNFSRRSFLALSATLPFALRSLAFGSAKSIPVGLELYSVRDALKQDPEGTVRAVAKMGYQAVEFYAPYFEWTDDQAKRMRKVLDELGIHCYSTHNDADYFTEKNINRARDLNLILGTKYVVLAWTDPKTGMDGWTAVADRLNASAEKLAPSGLKVGYHNHDAEFTPVNGVRPIEIIAKSTKSDVMLQLDVGRTGHRNQTRNTRCSSAKVWRTGREFSKRPRA